MPTQSLSGRRKWFSITLHGFIINTVSLEQNGGHFGNDINDFLHILIQISKFVPKDLSNNLSKQFQAMPLRWRGDKHIPESMLTQFSDANIWIIGEQWVKSLCHPDSAQIANDNFKYNFSMKPPNFLPLSFEGIPKIVVINSEWKRHEKYFLKYVLFIWSKINIWNVRGQHHSFSTHERMFLWKCQSFWDRKCLDLSVSLVYVHALSSHLAAHMRNGINYPVVTSSVLDWRFILLIAVLFSTTAVLTYPFILIVSTSPDQ